MIARNGTVQFKSIKHVFHNGGKLYVKYGVQIAADIGLWLRTAYEMTVA